MDAITSSPQWPFVVLLIGIASVVIMITVLRLHAFISLILTAIIVGLVSPGLPDIGQSWIVTAIELPMTEFGSMAGKIAWVIALAAVIGSAMMGSGAADRIVETLVKLLGEERVGIALVASGLILSIPVFFDTVFFLLIPLAISLGRRKGNDYVFYVLAIGGGAAISHSLVPPTPGPLIMAEVLEIDLGVTILAGLAASILPAIAVYWYSRRSSNRLGLTLEEIEQTGGLKAPESVEDDKVLPGIGLSVLPIVVPIVLISLVSIQNALGNEVPALIDFLGNKNMAMFIGMAIALWLWAKQKGLSLHGLSTDIGEALQIAGVIILITSAGGAFGAMIKHAGIGEAIEYATAGFEVNYLILAWIIAAVMKIAQGSSTVAMITASSILAGILSSNGQSVDVPPILILLSIGFGALFISWMNDSGFWVVAKMSGFTERQTLQTWTKLLAVIAIVGLLQLLVVSIVL